MRISDPLPLPIRRAANSGPATTLAMSTTKKTDADGPSDRPVDQIGNYATTPPHGTTDDPATTGALVLTGADALTLPLAAGGVVTLTAGQSVPDGETLAPQYAHLFGPASSLGTPR